MPPRPARAIQIQVPTNGANPCTPADFDRELPLRFTRAESIWRDLLPFLPWADELVARGSRPSYSAISFFEIEGLMLDFVDMTALRAERLIEVTFSVEAVFRVFNFMRLNNFVDSPCSSKAHFTATVRAAKLQLSSADLAVFTIRANEVCRFQAMGAPYGGSIGWLQELTWARAQDREGSFTTTIWILSLLGPRASSVSRSPPSRLTSIASRFGTAFTGAHSEFTFTSAEVASQLPGWVRAFKWPTELAMAPTDEDEAFSEFLRAYRFSQASASDKSTMVADVFDKVLAVSPSLASLAGEATPLQAYHAFRPLLKVFDVSSDPLLSDWQILDARVSGMLEIVASMPPSSELLVQRVGMLLEDEQATLRVQAGRADGGPKVQDGSSGFNAAIDPTTITILRRSAKLQAVVQQLQAELARARPRRTTVIKICLRSQLSGVVRYITGAVDTLQVNTIFGQITHYRASKLHVTSLDAISKALWLSVFRQDVKNTPRLKDCSFNNKFTYQLLTGDWSAIDFEQRLLFDVNAARSGQSYSSSHNRPSRLWFAQEHDIGDLLAPISRLFTFLGYEEASTCNSCAALLGQGLEGLRHARAYPLTAEAIQTKSRETIFNGFKDAQESWLSFFRDKSAAAPFPEMWLPEESTCAMALESAKKSSRTFTDWTADLGDLVQTSPFVQSPQPGSASKVGKVTDVDQLAQENKRLRNEIDKQMKANKKHKGVSPHLASHTCLHRFFCRSRSRLV
jgi:hypothetical protein